MSSPPPIEIPDPSLVVLVGAAGAGKSTFAARHFHPDEVLSSDAYREWIAGDAADQGATRAAFAALHRELKQRLGVGRLTLVDATSIQPHARAALLRLAAAAGIPAVAIVLDLPAPVVLARNAARRGRVVPEDAVRRQLEALEGVTRADHLSGEGFALVVRLRDAAEIDGVRIVRVRR